MKTDAQVLAGQDMPGRRPSVILVRGVSDALCGITHWARQPAGDSVVRLLET